MQPAYKFLPVNPVLLCLVLLSSSCKKFIEVTPPVTNITEATVYSNDGTAAAVLTSLYVRLSQSNSDAPFNGPGQLYYWAGLLADELTLHDHTRVTDLAYYENNLNSTTSNNDLWSPVYNNLFTTNAAISGLNSATTLSASVKQQLLGEAKFMRAFYNFYLVNLFGDVPLALSTDYRVNALLPRTPKADVYKQIINDLLEAEQSMASNYVDGSAANATNERVRPNKWIARALLARVYLYTGDYAKAEAKASEVIANTTLYDVATVPLDQVFLKNSKETIWALQPVSDGQNSNTGEGKVFVLPPTGPTVNQGYPYPVYLSHFLLDSFEPGDQRQYAWVDSAANFPYVSKYKAGRAVSTTVEYPVILRVAEQYLIRAEARNQLDDIAAAANDLNVIRNRAGLGNTTASTKAAMAVAIQHERQVELFTEWGHRWFDLKRTGTLDARMSVITPLKGNNTWKPYQALFPLPPDELMNNPGLTGHQNPGYLQ